MAAELDTNSLGPRFSPDGNNLVVSYGVDKNYTLGIYDLKSRQLRLLPKPEVEHWLDANFSPDGTKLTFISSPKTFGEQRLHGQVSIINLDGSAYRKITNSPTYKTGPSFALDGTKIIYARSNRILERKGGTPVDSDVYEVDVNGGDEVRLTHHGFNIIGRPHYFPDGQRFIFEAEAPTGKDVNWSWIEAKAYREKYGTNRIYVMTRGVSVSTNELRPSFTFGDASIFPSITRDGTKLLFVTRTNEMDGIFGNFNHDIFLRIDEQNNRLTRLGTFLFDAVISPDGKRVAFVSDPKRKRASKLFMMQSDGTNIEEIVLPIMPIPK